ncbi:hypothetical protein RKD18_000618 [Streptomyces phaeoluteigriseus]
MVSVTLPAPCAGTVTWGGGERELARNRARDPDRQVEGDGAVPGVGVRHLLRGLLAGRHRGVAVAAEGAAGGEHRAVDGRRRVQPATAPFVRGVVGGRLGGADQGVLELLPGPVRVGRGEQCGGTGDVRGGHRGAAQLLVVADALLGVPRAGRQDVDARRRDVRLQAGVARPRSGGGEARQPVGAVHRADGERGLGDARGGDGVPAVVARRDGEQCACLGAQPVDGLAQRVAAVGGSGAEAHADDLGVLVAGGPFHAGQHPGLPAAAVSGEDLADVQAGAGRDALLLAVGGGAGTGDGRGDVRSVAVAVLDVLVGHEARARGHLADQVGVAGVHAGVQDRDVHALTGVTARPHLRCADLPRGVGQVGLDLLVQPHLGDPAAQAGLTCCAAAVRRCGPAGQRGPEVGGLPALLRQRRAPDTAQGQGLRGAGGHRLGARPHSRVAVRDDQRQHAAAVVRVTVPQELGHVEEFTVQGISGYVGQGRLGEDVRVVAVLLGPGTGGPAARTLDPAGDSAVGGGVHGHPVTGDQGDRPGVRLRLCGGVRGQLGGGVRSWCGQSGHRRLRRQYGQR